MLRGRPVLGIALVAMVLAAAAVGGRALDSERQRQVGERALRSARTAAQRARDHLLVERERIALLGHNAVTNPRLMVALRGRVDNVTLKDIFTSEAWWLPYADLGLAISFEGSEITFQSGEGVESLGLSALVADARTADTQLSRFLIGGSTAFVVAATPMRFGGDAPPTIVVLVKPLGAAKVPALVELGKPIILTDGKNVLAHVGETGDVQLLETAIGREEQGGVALQDTAWGTAPVQVGPDLWVWAGSRETAFAREAQATAQKRKRVTWGLATGLSLLLFIASLRPRRPDPFADELDEAGAELAAPVPTLFPAADSQSSSVPTASGTATSLGRYMLLDRIGEGGMAEIFTAVSFGAGGFRRSFVVKRLRPEMNSNPVAVAHFVDEANLASTLVHPNIVPVFDFGQVAGAYFQAQEYIVGRDLGRLTRRMVERNLPALSPAAALYIAHEVLSGLHYAHEKRADDGTPLELVHRDVTPENIMISERGEVKVLDFGIVKATQRLSQTDIGMVKGNVDYMSPEQARGRPVDRRADVFSMGLVIYFSIKRTPLYAGETLYDRLTRAAMGPDSEEWAAVDALPAPLPEILHKALAIDPANRYQSADAFAQDIARHIAAGRGELTGALNAIFGDDLQLEQDRLAAAFPRSPTREHWLDQRTDRRS